MSKDILNNIGRFFLLVILQALLLNNIHLFGFISPYLYILFLLLLPIETPKWLSLVLGFILGLATDVFTQTLGVHVSACLFMVYCRPLVLTLIAPREGYEGNMLPTIRDMGLPWFATYSLVLVALHHLFLFFVEAFHFYNIFFTLLKILFSSLFTILLILIAQFLTEKKKSIE